MVVLPVFLALAASADPPAVRARYVRVEVAGTLSIAQLTVTGRADGTWKNVAAGKECSATEYRTQYNCKHALDEGPGANAFFHARSEYINFGPDDPVDDGADIWMEVDLGGEYMVTEVTIRAPAASENLPSNGAGVLVLQDAARHVVSVDETDAQEMQTIRTSTELPRVLPACAENVELPNTTAAVPDYYYFGCTAMKAIHVPRGVRTIGKHAFRGCVSLADVVLHDGIDDVGARAFQGCQALEHFTFPRGVTAVAEGTLKGCDSLKNLTLHDGITEIGSWAFQGCTSLEEFIAPGSMTKIAELTFLGQYDEDC
eukprot:TRINITY_DN1932_c0_g1_i6.p1 TRINITY_DN1932_c0_g1~~TRINITY_DN1932_c0_g1_i6.p1  ORF type:complete len:314 (+),score=45.01 TRINITY_DN1932_c0_g1_i6:115-1056(+)